MRADTFRLGFIAGMLAPVIGFFMYASMYVNVIRPYRTMHWFIFDMFLNTLKYQSSVLSLSLIADAFLFFWFDRKNKQKAMRGVIAAMMVYGLVIVSLLIYEQMLNWGWIS